MVFENCDAFYYLHMVTKNPYQITQSANPQKYTNNSLLYGIKYPLKWLKDGRT